MDDLRIPKPDRAAATDKTDLRKQAEGEVAGLEPRGGRKPWRAYPIGGAQPSLSIAIKPLPDETPILLCSKCGSMFGAITSPAPGQLQGLKATWTVICAGCIKSYAEQHDVKLEDRASWELALRLMER